MPATAIAIIASSQALQAQAEAAAAKKLACEGFVRGYQNDKATTVEMRQYAECVYTLTPSPPMTGSETILVKIAIVLLLFSIPIGGWVAHRNSYGGGWEDWVIGALLGPCALVIGGGVLALVIAGIVMVVS